MKALKVVLLVVVFVVLAVALLITQAGVVAHLTLLRPGFYVGSLARGGLFQALPEITMEYAADFLDQMPSDTAQKAREAWLEAATPEWFRSQFEVVLTDLFHFLRGEQASLTAAIALGEVRDRFVEAFAARVDPYSAKMMALTMAKVPETISLADQGFVPTEVPPNVTLGLQLASTVPPAAGAASVLLAGLCFLLAGGLVGGARWVGAAAMLSGSMTMAAFTFAQSAVLPGILAGIDLGEVPDFLRAVDPRAIAGGLAAGVLGTIRAVGVASLGAGLILVVVAAVAAARRRSPAAGSSAPTP